MPKGPWRLTLSWRLEEPSIGEGEGGRRDGSPHAPLSHNAGVLTSVPDPVADAQRRFGFARLERVARAPGFYHFWHGPRRQLLLDLLVREGVADVQAPLLDVGCGDGSLVSALRATNVASFGLDPWAERVGLDGERFRCGTVSRIPWPDAAFGTVCALDVLEDVDDRAALDGVPPRAAPGRRAAGDGARAPVPVERPRRRGRPWAPVQSTPTGARCCERRACGWSGYSDSSASCCRSPRSLG